MSALAKIQWLKPDQGGRTVPPPGPRYSTIARFGGQTAEEWSVNAWSLVLDLEGVPDEMWSQTARVRFLNEEEAPASWLQPAGTFALFEGIRKVAEGTILASAFP
jgi:hypothetical protein